MSLAVLLVCCALSAAPARAKGPEHAGRRDALDDAAARISEHVRNLRNLTHGTIDFLWGAGHYRLRYAVPRHVLAAARVMYAAVPEALRQVLSRYKDDVADSGAGAEASDELREASGAHRPFLHLRDLARRAEASAREALAELCIDGCECGTDDAAMHHGSGDAELHSGSLFYRGHLCETHARLLRAFVANVHWAYRSGGRVLQVLAAVGRYFEDHLWAVYYNVLVSGFCACIRHVPKHEDYDDGSIIQCTDASLHALDPDGCDAHGDASVAFRYRSRHANFVGRVSPLRKLVGVEACIIRDQQVPLDCGRRGAGNPCLVPQEDFSNALHYIAAAHAESDDPVVGEGFAPRSFQNMLAWFLYAKGIANAYRLNVTLSLSSGFLVYGTACDTSAMPAKDDDEMPPIVLTYWYDIWRRWKRKARAFNMTEERALQFLRVPYMPEYSDLDSLSRFASGVNDLAWGDYFLAACTLGYRAIVARAEVPSWLEHAAAKVGRTPPTKADNDAFWNLVKEKNAAGCCARFEIVARTLVASCPKIADGREHPYCEAFVRPYIIAISSAMSYAGDFPDLDFFMAWNDCMAPHYLGSPEVAALVTRVPLLVQSALPGSSFVVVPNHKSMDIYTARALFYDLLVNDGPWADKVDVATWRGGVSGPEFLDNVGDPCEWFVYPRQMLANLSLFFPDLLDAKMSEEWARSRCSDDQVKAMKALGLLGDFHASEQTLSHKYTFQVEGSGGYDGRTWLLQSSRSLLIRRAPVCLDWLQHTAELPDVHYVEVQKDFDDVVSTLRWLRGHDEEAERIAMRGRELSSEVRSIPMTWYAFVHLAATHGRAPLA